MLRKANTKFLSKVCECVKFQTRNSALFINGSKATESFTYVTPHIDFPDQLKQKDVIQANLLKRKSHFNLSKVEDLWAVYDELKQRKAGLEKLRGEISRELSRLIKTDPDGEDARKLKIQIDLVKDNIRKLKIPLWSAEEVAVVEALKLPNKLHRLTPQGDNTVIYSHLLPPPAQPHSKTKKDHLNIGKKLDLIHFKKNENYYLKNDAAVFELGAKFYFSNVLKKNNFVQFSNPDFVKSLIVEGCGEDHTNPDSTFILHHNEETKVNADSRLHLVGGASLASFLAYHTKNVLFPKVFPMKYFTMGRQYVPSPSPEDSLFHVSQSTAVQFFGGTKTEPELDLMLEELIETVKQAYKHLNHHFRLSIVSAQKLAMWESLRIALEMYSTSLNGYVEVANISLSGDFIPKRLLFTYVENKESKFPHLISGTVLNVPKFLGCVLEQDCEFTIPEQFQVENWGLQMEGKI